MNAQSFCYWLQGFCELTEGEPTPEQWKSIKDHLSLTFNKVTPPVERPVPPLPGALPQRDFGQAHDLLYRGGGIVQC